MLGRSCERRNARFGPGGREISRCPRGFSEDAVRALLHRSRFPVEIGDIMIEEEDTEAAEAAYWQALGVDAPSTIGQTKLAAALRLQGKSPTRSWSSQKHDASMRPTRARTATRA